MRHMTRRAYPNYFYDKEETVTEPYVPKIRTGGRLAQDGQREMIKAIAYVC
jgi:hypothetical protein